MFKYLFLVTGIMALFDFINFAFFGGTITAYMIGLYCFYFTVSMVLQYYKLKKEDLLMKRLKGYEDKWLNTMQDKSLTKQQKEDIINTDLVSIFKDSMNITINGEKLGTNNETHKED